jgi:hypothetical protein
VVCFLLSSAQARYGGGKGTAADPYQIWTAEHMQDIGTNKADWTRNFKLFADIDLSGYVGDEFNIIGYYSEHNNKPFTGIFDGNGHTISNFTYDSNGVNYIGIFGYVYGEAAEIKNLVLTDPNVNGLNGMYVGSLVGWADGGRITNCNIVSGTIAGKTYVGGLVGYSYYGTVVADCSAECDVYGDSYVGGLAGRIHYETSVSNCHSEGTVTANHYVGGLIGYCLYETVISQCYSAGSVSATGGYIGGLLGWNQQGDVLSSYSNSSVSGDSYVGGLVGVNGQGAGAANLLDCHATGTVTSSGFIAGGLVGNNGTISQTNSAIISNCYSTGNVISSSNVVGGLVGSNLGGISNSHSTGDVTGTSEVGGLVGAHQAYQAIYNCRSSGSVSGTETVGGLIGRNESNGEIYNCNSETGVVYGESTRVGGQVALNYGFIHQCSSSMDVWGNDRVGGLVGYNSGGEIFQCYSRGNVDGVVWIGGLVGRDDSGTCTDSFWDTESSGEPISAGGTGKTTAEMQTKSTFTDAGWDFVEEVINGPNDIWTICEGTNYPKFVWQIHVADFTCPYGVTLPDFSILGSAWYTDPNLPNWNPICDISEPNDNFIDELDLDVFTENYLTGF